MRAAPQTIRKFPAATEPKVGAVPAPRRTAVLHMTRALEVDADARALVDLALLTHRGGWRPLVASAGGSLVLEAERAAVRHTNLPLHRRDFLTQWRNKLQLEALVTRESPALIHTHGEAVIEPALQLSLAKKIPLLVELTEPLAPTIHNRKLMERLVAGSARFMVPSDFMATHLRTDLQLKTPYLYRIQPGVDVHWYEASRISAERLHALSRAWRLPESGSVIITATPLDGRGGHKELLQALAQVARPDIFTVMITGPTTAEQRASYEQMVRQYGLEGKVIMPEQCPDWPAACWLASLVVAVNSKPRGQAPELLAAQALGRPAIISDCGVNRELVCVGETAWLVPANDQPALAKVLAEATALNGTQRIDLAARTRQFVCDHFPQNVWVESIFELYGAMLAAPMESLAPLPVEELLDAAG